MLRKLSIEHCEAPPAAQTARNKGKINVCLTVLIISQILEFRERFPLAKIFFLTLATDERKKQKNPTKITGGVAF
jgi:hypothetical protein